MDSEKEILGAALKASTGRRSYHDCVRQSSKEYYVGMFCAIYDKMSDKDMKSTLPSVAETPQKPE